MAKSFPNVMYREILFQNVKQNITLFIKVSRNFSMGPFHYESRIACSQTFYIVGLP